jgi:hypothetical protein
MDAPRPSGWLSLSGAPLKGDRLVRFVCLDEAGLSHREDEPFTVDAVVIVNPDRDMRDLEGRLATIRADVPGLDESTVFHAKDLWHGTGAFPRDKYDRETRVEILRRIAAIPSEMSLPVVAGWVARDVIRPTKGVKPKDVAWMERHAPIMVAFASCVFSAEMWLRQHAPNEIAMLVHEDTDHARGLRNELHYFQSPAFAGNVGAPKSLLPLVRIKDDIMFASKRGSQVLQVADTCAFLIKRQLSRKADSYELFSLMEAQVVPSWTKSAELFS